MPSADRNLLFGILAFQNNFVSRDELMAALQTWLADKSQDLGQLLQERGVLTKSQHGLLSGLIDEFIKKLGSAEKCLEKLSSISDVRDELSQLNDPDLQQSLGHVGRGKKPADDPSKTLNPSVGSTSAVGARFRILRPHAQGGLGVVSVAHDEELNREVALKEIKGHCADDPDSRARFTLEAEITGGLEHPGIVPVYGLGTYADGRPFYAMRFIRGDSLSAAIQDYHTAAPKLTETERNLRLRRLLQRFIDVCEAMHYAHSRGVLHRDLKPSNIMLGKYGETLVVDWGLARAGKVDTNASTKSVKQERSLHPRSDSSPTVEGQAVGTPAYMSPEQAAGRLDLLGPATDIYALGATLYAILAGQPPISGKDTAEILSNVTQGHITPPREINRQLPRALEAIALRALALEPEKRYATARALADDVEQWLADEPVQAYREPMIAQAKRTLRKRPMLAGSILATLLVGLVAFGIGWVVVSNKNWELSNSNAALAFARNDAVTQKSVAERQKANAEAHERTAIAQKKEAQTQARIAEKNAEEAAASARLAESQRERLRKAMDFLVAAFRKPDPTRDGRELKAADLLISAAKEAEDTFQDEPLLLGELLNAIWLSLQALGLPRESLPIAEAAASIRKQELGPEHPDTLISINNLASTYEATGQFDIALPLFEENLKRSKAKFGDNHPNTLESKNNLASLYEEMGEYNKALLLFEEVLGVRQTEPGPNHRDTLRSANNLASVYTSIGNFDRALEIYQDTLRKSVATLGADHPDTFISMNNLANAYRNAKQLDKALPLGEQVLIKMRAKLGPDHPDTLTAMSNLATIYSALGDVDKALRLSEEALDSRKSKLGVDHPDTLRSMNNLAAVYFEAGRRDKALALWEETLELRKAKLGHDHPSTLTSMSNLAQTYYAVGQHDKALSLLELALETRTAKLGLHHPDTLESLSDLAIAHYAAGRYDKAVPLFEKTLKGRRDVFGSDDPATVDTARYLALTYASAGQFDKATPLFEETFQKRRVRLGVNHPDTIKSIANLLMVYVDSGQLAKVNLIWPDFIAAQRKTVQPESAELASLLAKVSLDLLRVKAWGPAEEALREALAVRQRHEPEEWTTFNTLAMLGGALAGRGAELLATDKPAAEELFVEAEPLLTVGYAGMVKRKQSIPAGGLGRLTEAAQRLIAFYTVREKPELTAKWQAELEKLKAEFAETMGEEKQPARVQPVEVPRSEGEQLQGKKSEEQKPAEKNPAESP